MIETEGKFLISCEDMEAIESSLIAAGFSLIGEKEEVDRYYSHPCRDFLLSDEALRLREDGDGLTLTYKGPRDAGKFKSRLEISTLVSSDIKALLERLGFVEALMVRKRRRYLRRDSVVVSIDRVESLGCFVEIEGSEAEIEEISRQLNLGQVIRETYVEMLLKARRR